MSDDVHDAHKYISRSVAVVHSILDLAANVNRVPFWGADLLSQIEGLADLVAKAEAPLDNAVAKFRQTKSEPVTFLGQTARSVHELAWELAFQIVVATKGLNANNVHDAPHVLKPYGLSAEELGKLAAELDREVEAAKRLKQEDEGQADVIEQCHKSSPKAKDTKRRGKNINGRMLDAIQNNQESLGWNSRQWAEHLKCAKSSVVATKTWKDLGMARERNKAERAKDRRRRPKASDSRRD